MMSPRSEVAAAGVVTCGRHPRGHCWSVGGVLGEDRGWTGLNTSVAAMAQRVGGQVGHLSRRPPRSIGRTTSVCVRALGVPGRGDRDDVTLAHDGGDRPSPLRSTAGIGRPPTSMPSLSVPQTFGSVFHDPRELGRNRAFAAGGSSSGTTAPRTADAVVGEAAVAPAASGAALERAPADPVGADVVVAVTADAGARHPGWRCRSAGAPSAVSRAAAPRHSGPSWRRNVPAHLRSGTSTTSAPGSDR